MPISLDAWQERLEKHFSTLSETRDTKDFPVFAIEHGLTTEELEEISGLLRSRLRSNLSLHQHWLLWTIYATEIGYGYDGHEFWTSFIEATPYWATYGSKRSLRSWFAKFQKAYCGVVPSGLWARYFRFIALPITHALLPKYLQDQFAETMFHLRHQLARKGNLSAAEAGRMMAGYAWDGTTRFREFLQQEELSGRLMLALLRQEVASDGPIHPATLTRIVRDLESVQNSRRWLNETRRYVSDQFHGLARAGIFPVRSDDNRPEVLEAGLDVKPNIFLHRKDANCWAVVAEVPPLAGLARVNPELRTFLRTTRARIAGTGEGWLAAGAFLNAAQRRSLLSWPKTTETLIQFERANGTLDYLLNSEARLTPGIEWLFRVGPDGRAREIIGKGLRPGQQYIHLSLEPISTTLRFFSPCTVACSGVHAVKIALPDALPTVDEIDQLHKLGFLVNRKIRIWPAGFPAQNWDGEGHCEWLSTETPFLGVVHDHPVDEFVFKLNNEPQTVIEGVRAGDAIFVQLPVLSPGLHQLSVTARRIGLSHSAASSPDLDGTLAISIREPRPWVRGTSSHVGMIVTVDPPEPTLDAFWEGHVGISVLGPEGHKVSASITLTKKSSPDSPFTAEIGSLELPITPENWRSKFSHFLKDDSNVWKYLEATSGTIEIKADELGRYSLRLERDIRALRWQCRNANKKTTVRLIDDADHEEPVSAHFYPFSSPLVPEKLSDQQVHDEYLVERPGGLLVAKVGEMKDALVVSDRHVAGGFQGLRIEPSFPPTADVDFASACQLVELWSRARIAGPLGPIRRDYVVECMRQFIASMLGGSQWIAREKAFSANPRSEYERRSFERSVATNKSFAAALYINRGRYSGDLDSAAEWFAEVAGRYHVCADKSLSKLALAFAGNRGEVFESIESGGTLEKLRSNPELFRGARFFILSGQLNPILVDRSSEVVGVA